MRYNINNIDSMVNENYIEFPRVLLYGVGRYRKLSSSAKLIYCWLRDKKNKKSDRNGWVDDKGNRFIYYKMESLAKDTNQSVRNLHRIITELMECGLIEYEKDGRMNKYYIHEPEYEQNTKPRNKPTHKMKIEISFE